MNQYKEFAAGEVTAPKPFKFRLKRVDGTWFTYSHREPRKATDAEVYFWMKLRSKRKAYVKERDK